MRSEKKSKYNGLPLRLDQGLSRADEVVEFLESKGIIASSGSYLEDDYLNLHEELGAWKNNEIGNWSNFAKAAMYGFVDLHNWIWSVKDHPEFEKLLPHLRLLTESSIRFNALSPMINTVSGKQDDKSNKLIETFLGLYALKIGTDLDLDHPKTSSGGSNPDILFTYNKCRIAIACKTPRSTKFETILDNCRSARNQIDRANCDIGFIAINVMNLFPHKETNDYIYYSLDYVDKMLGLTVDELYRYDDRACRPLWGEIFADSKTCESVLTLVNSYTQIKDVAEESCHQDHSLKRTCRHTFASHAPEQWLLNVFEYTNHFLHGRHFNI